MRRGGLIGIAALALILTTLALGWGLLSRSGQASPAVEQTLAQLDGPQLDVRVSPATDSMVVHLDPDRMNDEKTGTFVSEPAEKPAEPERPPELAQKPKDPKNPKDPKKNKDLELEPRDYSKWLKSPDSMGFDPDAEYFRNVYWQIRENYVEKVNEDALFNGLKAEVANLLKQAKVSPEALKRLDKSKNVLVQLVDLYGNKVDDRLLTLAAIYGMLDGLKDPYSVLMTPEEYRKLQEQMQAVGFGGIGIYIELDRENKNQLTVFEPIEGTPAAKVGLESGDQILKIDGKLTKNITLDMAQAAIRGKPGTSVVLTIKRRGATPRDFTVTRQEIQVVSVTSKLLDNQIGYVRLRQFGQDTAEELEQGVQNVLSQGAKGIVVDLRNNGGGYIDAAVGVVGQFLRRGSLVVYTVNRTGKRRDYNSSVSGDGPHVPVVVLINEYSASASEITAGALRDHKVATLVGTHSFGKGSVQQLYPFPDDSALKLTIARFYSPSGKVIDKKGIEPDVSLKMEPRFVGKVKNDTQLQKAIELINKQAARAGAP
ncbi:S41 family peptidase [bacterium CPR1]|nr:S41 family peptidase [bacterium CPR1]